MYVYGLSQEMHVVCRLSSLNARRNCRRLLYDVVTARDVAYSGALTAVQRFGLMLDALVRRRARFLFLILDTAEKLKRLRSSDLRLPFAFAHMHNNAHPPNDGHVACTGIYSDLKGEEGCTCFLLYDSSTCHMT